jgi:hypothetical protein
MTPLGHFATAAVFAISALSIGHNAYRQRVPPLSELRHVDRAQVSRVYLGENFGIALLRDEYVAVDLRAGGTVRYRQSYSRYEPVKRALLSSDPFQIWIGSDDHFHAIYQVESDEQVIVSFGQVRTRMRQNIALIVAIAVVMGLVIAPYYIWRGWQEVRRLRATNGGPTTLGA